MKGLYAKTLAYRPLMILLVNCKTQSGGRKLTFSRYSSHARPRCPANEPHPRELGTASAKRDPQPAVSGEKKETKVSSCPRSLFSSNVLINLLCFIRIPLIKVNSLFWFYKQKSFCDI